MIVEQDGTRYNFTGLYDIPQKGEPFLGYDGTVQFGSGSMNAPAVFALAEVVRDTFEDGGIVWEYTGERRKAHAREWYVSYVSHKHVVRAKGSGTAYDYDIVRPFGISKEDDDEAST